MIPSRRPDLLIAMPVIRRVDHGLGTLALVRHPVRPRRKLVVVLCLLCGSVFEPKYTKGSVSGHHRARGFRSWRDVESAGTVARARPVRHRRANPDREFPISEIVPKSVRVPSAYSTLCRFFKKRHRLLFFFTSG